MRKTKIWIMAAVLSFSACLPAFAQTPYYLGPNSVLNNPTGTFNGNSATATTATTATTAGNLSGNLALPALGGADTVLGVNGGASALNFFTLVPGENMTITPSGTNLTFASTASPANPNLLINSEYYDLIGVIHPSSSATACGGSPCQLSNDIYNVAMWNGYYSAANQYTYVGVIQGSTDPTTVAGSGNMLVVNHQSGANIQTAAVQILSNMDTAAVRGRAISVSYQAEGLPAHNLSASGLTAGILCSASAVDATTAVVASWAATPTWGAGWTLIASSNTGTPGTAWRYYNGAGIQNIPVPNNGTCNQIAFIWWTPGTTEASGAEWHLANPKVEIGASSTAYSPSPVTTSLNNTYRYVWPFFVGGLGYNDTATGYFNLQYPQAMTCSNPAITPTGLLEYEQELPSYVSSTQSAPQAFNATNITNRWNDRLQIGNFAGLGNPGIGRITEKNYRNYIIYSCEP